MEPRLIRHGLVDSTSERAFAALADGSARHLDVHVATGQTAGRGRRGATWHSAPGEGLYLSAVLLPAADSAFRPEALSLAGVLAVRTVLLGLFPDALGGAALSLKWPNDLLLAGAKLSGVLTESRGFDPGRPHAVLGIGINVRQRGFPPELTAERPVTSLRLAGCDIGPERLLQALLPELTARLVQCERDPQRVAGDYCEDAGLTDARVTARTARERFEGRFLGISWERGLQLRLEDGSEALLPLGHVRSLQAVDD